MSQKPEPRGATRQSLSSSSSTTKTRLSTSFHFASYLRDHQKTLLESFIRLLHDPLASMMTMMVIAIALSLPGGLYVGLKNVHSITNQWDKQSIISLYLFANVEDTKALSLSHQLSSRSDIVNVMYVSKEEGMRYFEKSNGYEEILSALPENPLPIVLQVIPSYEVTIETLPNLESLRDELAGVQEVEYAELDAQWLHRLASLLSFGERFVYALSLLLICAVLLIVGNTIRMAVESRRDEVLVMKLVGATDGFIRRPFLYMGFWFGILGGILACTTILLVSWWVSTPAERIIALYQSDFTLQSFNADEVVLCLTMSAFVGVIGAWIAVNRHISDIELQ